MSEIPANPNPNLGEDNSLAEDDSEYYLSLLEPLTEVRVSEFLTPETGILIIHPGT